jgi:hypothetical protein
VVGGPVGGVFPGTVTGGVVTTTVGEFTGQAPCWNCEPQPGWGYQTVAPETKVQNKSDYGTDGAKPELAEGFEQLRLTPRLWQVFERGCFGRGTPLFFCSHDFMLARCNATVRLYHLSSPQLRIAMSEVPSNIHVPDEELDLRGVICPTIS